MRYKPTPRGPTRRQFLIASGQTALLAALAGSGVAKRAFGQAELPRVDIRLLATDGFFSLPGRRRSDGNGLYGFGFRGVQEGETFADPGTLIPKYKFRVQWPSPILAVDKNIELYITMTNLGFEVRPDLDDSHTIHWHGFRNPNAIFDGVPEVSIAVPPARNFPYFYRPRNEGTYMYHCHFEDTEHVQLGMDGVVYIKALNERAYDSDGGVTAFDREFTLLLNDIDQSPHDGLAAVQEFLWSDYNSDYWVINGRAYPDTLVRDQELETYADGDFNLPDAGLAADPDLGFSQPVSSLIQLEEGETGLLRFVNLGFEQQAMQLLGPRMRVVGHDAVFLGAQRYETSTLYIGPGESRDVLVTAPAYASIGVPAQVDGAGRPYKMFWLRNRNSERLVNGSEAGLGGQVTQMWVYPSGTIPAQLGPNQTV